MPAGLFYFRSAHPRGGVELTKMSDTESPRPARGRRTGERPHAVQVHAAREQVAATLPALRDLQLLSRQEIMAVTGLSYPTLWQWMREGKFPSARIVGGKSMWRATEIDAWINALPTAN